MSSNLSNFNRLPIEYITLDAATPLLIILLGFIQVFVCAILGWDSKIYAYFLGPDSSSSKIRKEQSNLEEVKEMKKTEDTDNIRVCLKTGDLEIVFKSLGLFSWDFSGFNSTSMYGFRVVENGSYTCGAIPTKRFKKSPSFSPVVGEKTEEILESSKSVADSFEEADATLEEVRAAFDVYDENKDGFIDEFELQKVLCGLGFKEGLKIENCRKMIVLGDNNGDGRLDFNEFVNFLQNNIQF